VIRLALARNSDGRAKFVRGGSFRFGDALDRYGEDRRSAVAQLSPPRVVDQEGSGMMRDWKLDAGDVRSDPRIAEEILEFMARHSVLSVAMTDRIIGCPHHEGIDYHGQWCPVCEFWKGRDRFTGERVY
jgi:hypothetical protein